MNEEEAKLMKSSVILVGMILAGGALLVSARLAAQDTQGAPPTLNPEKKQQAKPTDVSPLTLDSPAPPVNAEEDAAYKAFRDLPMTDVDKKNPNDAQTMAILGSTLPRAMNSSTPNPQQRLDKAEQYSKKALELLPTMPKPPEISEENFLRAKDQTSALAYSGLGLVAFRRKKFAEAIPNFEQAVKLDPTPDPVNFYLLGVSDQQTAHYDDAVSAFTKCAAIPGGMQGTCKTNADEAKKLGATQLSAPK